MKKIILILGIILISFPVYADSKYGSMWKQNDTTLLPADDISTVDVSGVVSQSGSGTFTNLSVSDVFIITGDGPHIFGGVNASYGFGTYTSDHQIYIRMRPDVNILIDGRTNPRTYTLGTMRFEQTPDVQSTRAINIDVDMNSQADTHAVNVNYRATGMTTGDYGHIYDGHVDTANSTGGDLGFYTCGVTGDGLVDVNCIDIYAQAGVIEHHSGTLDNMDNGWIYDGAFTNATGFFNNEASNTEIFTDNLDYIYVCDAGTFNDIAVNLGTVASGAGVKPVAQYTAGASAWTTFTVADGTNGFRQSGNIRFILDDIPAWTTDTVNGVANQYCVRVQRTQVTVGTPPIEDTIKIVASTDYRWDKNGDVNINSLTVTPFTKHHDVTAPEVTLGVTGPTTDTIGIARGLGFDADAEEIYFSVEIPDEWVGASNFSVNVKWAPSTAPADTETVKFDIDFRTVADGEDIDGTAVSTSTATYTQSGAGTAGEQINTTITVPYNDATNPIVAGDNLYIRFDRDVTGDTFGGKAVVFDWDVEYQANSLSTH